MSLYSSPNLRRLWTAQLVSVAGDYLALFTVIAIVRFQLHATAAQLAGVSIAYILPLAALGPFAGVFVDRWNVKTTMIVSDLVRAALILLLLCARQLHQIYLILFALSAVSTFFLPAQSVALRSLVPRDALLAANSFVQRAVLITRLLSPALAGLLAAKTCFYLDAASFLLSAFLLAGITIPPRPRPTAPPPRDFTSGIRCIFDSPPLAFILVAMTTATLAISFVTPLIALLSPDVHHYSLASVALSLGMLAGTVCPIKRITLGLTIMSAGVLLIPVITPLGTFLTGAGLTILMLAAQTQLQTGTPIPLAGRISSTVVATLSGAQIAGLILSGALTAVAGPKPILFLTASLLVAFLWRRHSVCRAETHLGAFQWPRHAGAALSAFIRRKNYA